MKRTENADDDFDFDTEGDELLSSFYCEDLIKTESETSNQIDTEPEQQVTVPETFAFPFEPYDIQKGFMRELYRSLELGKIGIFESPTGTGKSLSLICGSLKWLKDFQEKQKKELDKLMQNDHESENATNSSEVDWIKDFAIKKEKEENLKKIILEQEQTKKREAKLKAICSRPGKRKRSKLDEEFEDLIENASDDIKKGYNKEMNELFNNNETSESQGMDDDDKIVLADYESDDGAKSEANSEDEIEEESVTKIYYCSRTHSQLSQFVREVVKSPFGQDIRVTSLGSRQNLCINDVVKQLKSISLINDRCLELQKNKKEKRNEDSAPKKRQAKGGGCPYYKHELILDLKDRILVEVQDVEQLVTAGKKLKACPYYSSRYAIPAAEIVSLPYNTLLHKSTRKACGIRLEGNVVIIDEAHNLMETINNVYSVEITGGQVLRAHSQLTQYEMRYRSRLKAKNLMYIRQILFILTSFLKCMGGKPGIPGDKQCFKKSETKLRTINDFLFDAGLDNMNLFKVKRYCEMSKISQKMQGFVEKYQVSEVSSLVEKKKVSTKSGLSQFLQDISQKPTDLKKNSTDIQEKPESKEAVTAVMMTSPLMLIEGFLEALTNADKDGRIVMSRQILLSQSSLKFLLLNPAVHFASIVKDARAVIVAGGTMQPISEFKDQLFHAAGVLPDRILEYSCGHVIPPEQLLPMALCSGPTGVMLDFTYQSRNSSNLLDELGRIFLNVCNVIPGGIVCFFPSYDYEKLVHSHLESAGLLCKIALKKKVFREAKRAGQADLVLAEYTDCIEKSKSSSVSTTGAILFSVVGGKMSEGINFSDDLGRCVIMVGLPYPNINSPELKEKIDYLNATFPRSADGRLPGQVHYENLCMKAVNQSIGRAIRHKEDYATLLLLDQRYSRGNVASKLPGWISQCLQKHEKFGPVLASISRFFAKN